MQIIPIVAVELDSRRQKKYGKYPVKLRVTFKRDQRLYPFGFDLSEEQFRIMQNDTLLNKHPDVKERKLLKDFKAKCEKGTVEARQIIEGLKVFNYSKFENEYKGESMSDDVYTSFQQVIDQLNVEGRIGTRDNYKCSMACLKRFKPRVSFSNITPNFLKSFEPLS
jgi:hypothetical protein